MKILHCIYDHVSNPWVGGGGAIRAYEIYRRLARTHDITVICGRYPGASDYKEGGLKFHFEGASLNNYVLSTFGYAFKTAKYLKSHAIDFDVVVEDFAPYNPVWGFIWRKDCILQLHQREGFTHLRKYFLLGTAFYLSELIYPRLFKNVVVLNNQMQRRFGIGSPAAVIPNGFDPLLLKTDTDELDYMLFIGRLHIDQKGLDTLERAIGISGKDVRLVIAGSGKDSDKVDRLYADHKRRGLVRIIGYVSGRAKIDWMRNCKFIVMPSRYEGQPLGVIEAAALGKPLLVSDIPELEYVVREGFGISFRKNDAGDLAEKISILLRDNVRRTEMGIKARSFASKFTWDVIAGKYERLLMEIDSSRRK